MLGYTLVKQSDIDERDSIIKGLSSELSHWREDNESLLSKLEVANKTIGKLQTHLKEAKETVISKELTDRELLLSKEVKQIAYAIFHQYCELRMDKSIIKNEEKAYQNVYKCYIQHLKKLQDEKDVDMVFNQ